MNHLKSLSNDLLWISTQDIVKKERETSLEVLGHLREIESRGLHFEKGFSSMHDYCTRGLGYSAAAAYRRVEAARLLQGLPAPEVQRMERKIESGELAMSTIAMVQGFFKNEKKNDRPYSMEEKQALLEEVSGKSTRQVEKILVALAPESVPSRKESQRVVTPELTQMKFLADEELLQLLEKVKDLSGGKNAYPDMLSLLKQLARFYLSRKDPERKVKEKKDPSPAKVPAPEQPEQEVRRRTPTVPDMRHLWSRAGGRCEFVDTVTGKRCECRRNLEADHVVAYSKGGETTIENLQLLCALHHRHKTIREFGKYGEIRR